MNDWAGHWTGVTLARIAEQTKDYIVRAVAATDPAEARAWTSCAAERAMTAYRVARRDLHSKWGREAMGQPARFFPVELL